MTNPPPVDRSPAADSYRELKVLLPDELFRAWQRCSWLIVNESGKTRLEVMEEMVRDFLYKHGC